MLKRILSFFRDASGAPPSEPAPSTFGADADRIETDRERAADWETEVAIQKGRVKGFWPPFSSPLRQIHAGLKWPPPLVSTSVTHLRSP